MNLHGDCNAIKIIGKILRSFSFVYICRMCEKIGRKEGVKYQDAEDLQENLDIVTHFLSVSKCCL